MSVSLLRKKFSFAVSIGKPKTRKSDCGRQTHINLAADVSAARPNCAPLIHNFFRVINQEYITLSHVLFKENTLYRVWYRPQSHSIVGGVASLTDCRERFANRL